MYGGVERIAAVLQELVCRAQVVQEGGAVSLVERWWELIAGDVAGAAVDDKGGFKEVWALCISHCFFFSLLFLNAIDDHLALFCYLYGGWSEVALQETLSYLG